MVTVVQPILSEKETEALKRILNYLAGEERGYAELSAEERPNHIFHSVLVLRSSGLFSRELFDVGATCSTPGALAAMERANQEPW